MARFFGKNDTTQTRGLMGERNSYYVNAYSKDPNDNLDIKPIVDFNFAERVYYGRVTENLDSVYPNPEFIKPVVYAREPQNAPQLMDFVSDMFTDLSTQSKITEIIFSESWRFIMINFFSDKTEHLRLKQ